MRSAAGRHRLIHHKAALDGTFPPNSLDAIRACLEADAYCIEIDIAALADGDFLVVHDLDLASETTGRGKARDYTAVEARELFIRAPEGAASTHRVPQLGDVVQLFRDAGGETLLQLDFKDERPYPSDEPLERLLGIIEPVSERVMVSSVADWQLNRLRTMAPSLRLAFDPMFYLAWWPPENVDPALPPRRMGAYGYLDDHPLADVRDMAPAAYLAERCRALLALVPGIHTLFVYHGVLTRALEDGFNCAEACRAAGVDLAAWTLDVRRPGHREVAERLAAAGVEVFTTDTPWELQTIFG